MVDIIALIQPKAEHTARVESLLLQTCEKVKANEPGTLKYHLQRETKAEGPVFVMLEQYRDKASLQAHGQTDYFKEMGRAFKNEGLLAEPMKVLFTKEVGGYASKL